MKKIILYPKTDTVIICLPQEWIGTPVACKLVPLIDLKIDADVEISPENLFKFFNNKRRRKKY